MICLLLYCDTAFEHPLLFSLEASGPVKRTFKGSSEKSVVWSLKLYMQRELSLWHVARIVVWNDTARLSKINKSLNILCQMASNCPWDTQCLGVAYPLLGFLHH